MRLIDADALVFKNCNGNIEYNRGVENCVDIVMSAQTVQAVPIEVLQEIRQEIEHLYKNNQQFDILTIINVLSIIDKHIKEVE